MVIVESKLKAVSARGLARFAARARRVVRLRGRVDVLIASRRRMRQLNRRFRRHDRVTDVLSFPAVEFGGSPGLQPGEPRSPSGKVFGGGDIVVCAEVASANARRLGHSLAGELKVLILHGMLHLAGYDHETDNGRMARKERALRRELRLPQSLTERVDAGDSPALARPRSAVSTRSSRGVRP